MEPTYPLDTGAVGQHDIEHDDVEAIASESLQGISTRLNRFHAMRSQLKIADEESSGLHVVIHYEHTHLRLTPPCS